jgi:hypothetical protein
MRHNRLVPIQRWRSPVTLRVKSAVFAIIWMAVAVVFFPLWFAIPVAVLIGVSSLGGAITGTKIVVDAEAGRLAIRFGPIAKRIRLADVTAVIVDGSKVSIARTSGWEISVYAWRKSRLDRWLRIPVVASDIGHAISAASASAREAKEQARDQARGQAASHDATTAPNAAPPAVLKSRDGALLPRRSVLGLTAVGAFGLIAIGSAFLVRLHWSNPVMTALAVVLVLALGIIGLFEVLVAAGLPLLLLLLKRPGAADAAADRTT